MEEQSAGIILLVSAAFDDTKEISPPVSKTTTIISAVAVITAKISITEVTATTAITLITVITR